MYDEKKPPLNSMDFWFGFVVPVSIIFVGLATVQVKNVFLKSHEKNNLN